MAEESEIISGWVLGAELCEVFGLDPDLISKITISSDASDVATVTVVRAIKYSEVGKLKRVFAKHNLVLKDAGEAEVPAGRDGIVSEVVMTGVVKKYRG